MSDIEPFQHGEDGTHFACDEQLKKYGDKTKCCGCTVHACKGTDHESN